MTFKNYLKIANNYLKKYPETANMKVITSIDDEGNSYNDVLFTPIMGYHYDYEFSNDSTEKNNAVCLN